MCLVPSLPAGWRREKENWHLNKVWERRDWKAGSVEKGVFHFAALSRLKEFSQNVKRRMMMKSFFLPSSFSATIAFWDEYLSL